MVAVGLMRNGPGDRSDDLVPAEDAVAANSSQIADFYRKRGSLMRPVSFGRVFCQAPLGRVVWPQAAYRPGFDGIDRQRPTADPPARLGQLVVVVVAQMPDQIDDL